MHERNVDFEIGLTPAQWSELTQTAEALESLGYRWNGKDPQHIHLRMRDEDVQGVWDTLVVGENRYGAHDVELAHIVYNDGRPYAHLEALPTLDEPNLTEGQEHEVEVGQERWVRSRWQDLLKRSGLHFEGDYTSPDVA